MELVRTLGLATGRLATDAIQRAAAEDLAAAVDVIHYLETLADRIISSLSKSGEIWLEADSRFRLVLPLSKAISLGLIVGELVTNAVKYAHPTGIAEVVRIESSRHNGALVIEISDDGVGLPEGLDPIAAGGGGLAMVRALALQLGAVISFDNHGLGLSCRLRMPYAEAAA